MPSALAVVRSLATSGLAYRSGPRTKMSSVAVRVARHEVGGLGLEGHEAAVGRDRRARMPACSPASRRSTRSRASSCPLPVAHEDVRGAVRVVAARGWWPELEGDEAAVGGDRRAVRSGAVRLRAGARHAHALGRAAPAVAHEDVRRPFVSPATRFAAALSKATKRPSAEIDGVRRRVRPACAPLESTLTRSVVPGLAVAHEDVVDAVRVARDEVRGAALEGHEAAVGRDRRAGSWPAVPPAPRARRRSRARSSRAAGRARRRRWLAFVSPATRFEAAQSKATKRPSAEIDGEYRLEPFASPAKRVDAHALVVPSQPVAHEDVGRSRSCRPARGSRRRLAKATKRPSAEIEG